jgi:hypothetical protein
MKRRTGTTRKTKTTEVTIETHRRLIVQRLPSEPRASRETDQGPPPDEDAATLATTKPKEENT